MQTGAGHPWIWDGWPGRADKQYIPKNYMSGDLSKWMGEYKGWKTNSGKRPSFGGIHYDGPADPWEEVTGTLPPVDPRMGQWYAGGNYPGRGEGGKTPKLDFKSQAIRRRLSSNGF